MIGSPRAGLYFLFAIQLAHNRMGVQLHVQVSKWNFL